jgi:hypothetical protein
MPTFSFPAASFVIEGDPGAVRETARAYGRFATTAGEAAAGLRALDSGSWVGSEGDLFRARVGGIPPPLDVANGAFAQVARALDGFADVLASAQGRMAGVRADAEHAFSALAGAGDGAGPGGLQDAWDDQLAAAAGLRSQVVEAAQQAAASVRAAGRVSPTAGLGWLANHWEDGQRWLSARVDDLKDFVAEHAGVLRTLAKGLRWAGMALVAIGAVVAVVSFVAGLFTDGIGWLGEIPAGTLIGAGLVLWGAGDTLDTTVDWAEGRISGELARSGVKHSPEKIVPIGRDPDGRIVFLETGSPSAGLEHILQKQGQFAQRGVGQDQVADYVLTAVTKGKVVGMQRTRPIYEFQWNGTTHRLAVTVGDNGYIVGANPVG